MQPIKAQRAGRCARTGQSYQAGALIVKTVKGWALAQDKVGHIKPTPDWRLCRMPDGTEKTLPLHLPSYCRVCIEADGLTTEQAGKMSEAERTPYLMPLDGKALVCPRCGRRFEIIPQAELDARKAAAEAQREADYLADMEANLHLSPCPYGLWQLSHRVPAEMWRKVADYFVYWSADDLEDFDFFDMPGGYYLRPGKAPEGVFLNSPVGADGTTAEAVEELLNIRPENRLAVLLPKWEREEAERKARQEDYKRFLSRFQSLFPRESAGYVDAAGNPFQYGAKKVVIPDGGERLPVPGARGREFYYYIEPGGAYVWHIYTNGADGDNWSADNTTWGIGYRFDLTPARAQFLAELKRQREEEKQP